MDFKLAGPQHNMAEGWKLLRDHLGIEEAIKVDAKRGDLFGLSPEGDSRDPPQRQDGHCYGVGHGGVYRFLY